MSALENLKNFIDQMEHPSHCCPDEDVPICFCDLLELQRLSAEVVRETENHFDDCSTWNASDG